MKIYVASSWRNAFQPATVATLRAAGHEVYDFRNPGTGGPPDAPAHGFSWGEIDSEWQSWNAKRYRDLLRHPIAKRGFDADKAALDWCDACLLILPCGRSAHLELGYAAGRAKRSAIYFPDGVEVEPELMNLLADEIVVGGDELETWAALSRRPTTDRGGLTR